MSDTYESATEIRDAINALTEEVHALRLLISKVINGELGGDPEVGVVRTWEMSDGGDR